jgi:hypothetical protein
VEEQAFSQNGAETQHLVGRRWRFLAAARPGLDDTRYSMRLYFRLSMTAGEAFSGHAAVFRHYPCESDEVGHDNRV